MVEFETFDVKCTLLTDKALEITDWLTDEFKTIEELVNVFDLMNQNSKEYNQGLTLKFAVASYFEHIKEGFRKLKIVLEGYTTAHYSELDKKRKINQPTKEK